MVDPRQKSRKRFRGKRAKTSPLKNFTLYLDESFDCQEVKDTLSQANIKFKIYSESFAKGSDDTQILEACGRRGWALLTCDRKNRYREAERAAVRRFKVRQFVFSGNLGAERMAELLVHCYPHMRDFARKNNRPFVAVVTAAGNIYLRMDEHGNVTDWQERKQPRR